MFPVSIDRFSPYFDQADALGVTNVRPIASYAEVVPPSCDPSEIAYHFEGDFASGVKRDGSISDINIRVESWRNAWQSSERPSLVVGAIGPDSFLKIDTRGLSDVPTFEFITRPQAMMALSAGVKVSSDVEKWALDRKVVVRLDDRLTPLAVAEFALLRELGSVVPSPSGDPRSLPILSAQ